MTVNEVSEQAEVAVEGENPVFRSSSPPTSGKHDSGPPSVSSLIEDEGGRSQASASVPPSITSVEDEVNLLESVGHVPPSITSVEDEVNLLEVPGSSSARTSLSGGSSVASTLAPLPRFDRFQSLTTPRGEGRDRAAELQSLPPTLAASLRRSQHFPRYKRQYKVESIYVNDLYTLTYDEDETLESIKSIEVHYVSGRSGSVLDLLDLLPAQGSLSLERIIVWLLRLGSPPLLSLLLGCSVFLLFS